MTTMVEAKKISAGLFLCGGGISGYLRRSHGVGDAGFYSMMLLPYQVP